MTAPTDLPECDLIMKGGITSGVVYPRAACRLAATYRFRRVGGTSVGAIAAAAVVAAEHGSGRDGGGWEGFVRLDRVPTALGTALPRLFQPQRRTRAAHGVLMAILEPRWGRLRKLVVAGLRAMLGAPVVTVVAAGVVLLPMFATLRAARGASGWDGRWLALGWAPPTVVGAAIAAAVSVGIRTWRALPTNGFGLCRGHGKVDGRTQLTDWLCATVDEIAGLPPGAGPLTFGQLWNGTEEQPGEERAKALRDDPEQRAVDLEVVTTDLTLGRPFRFPFETNIFHWCYRCWADYFPARVLAALGTTEAEDKIDKGTLIEMRCPTHGDRVRTLPTADRIPIVVAARLSMSYPLLISAVPLYAIDFTRPVGKRRLVVHWMSDGGISSNFPMHLFDELVPRRPTFGIDLDPVDPDRDDLVWRPTGSGSGFLLPLHPVTTAGQFLNAIKGAMQNWADVTLASLPGYRDRIAHVRLAANEGGLNLRMPADVITTIADRGAEAAQLFLGSTMTEDETPAFDFDFHRWVRYRTLMSSLDVTLDRMYHTFDGGLKAFLDGRPGHEPPYPFSGKSAAKKARAETDALLHAAATWAADGRPHSTGDVPKPKPDLRMVPRI